MISIESLILAFLFGSFYLGAFAVTVWFVYTHIAGNIKSDAESRIKTGKSPNAVGFNLYGLRKNRGWGNAIKGGVGKPRSALNEVD